MSSATETTTETPKTETPAKPETPEKPKAPELLKAPELPANAVFDLSLPVLKRPDGITFQLPRGLGSGNAGKPLELATDLTPIDWMVIARDSGLQRGFCMDQSPPSVARRSVLHWKAHPLNEFLRSRSDRARIETAVVYTEESHSFVRMGFNSQSATATFPFASASFERQRREREASAAENTRLHMTGMWSFPRATLYLDRCAVVSPDFVAEARAAVKANDPVKALEKLFNDFGHAYSAEVTLGGTLLFQQTTTTSAKVSTTEVEEVIKAAISIKTTKGAGTAGASFQVGENKSVSAKSLSESTSFEGIGGDTLLIDNPDEWRQTVRQARLWAVIARDDVRSTIGLLDEDLQKEIHRIAATQPRRSVSGLFLGAVQTAKNAKDQGQEIPYRETRTNFPQGLHIAQAMAWSPDYQWGNSHLYLTTGSSGADGAKIVRGGRQQRGRNTNARVNPALGMDEIHQWGSRTGEEIVVMEAAAYGPNGWSSGSLVSLYVENYSPKANAGFLIVGGRVEISSADAKMAFTRHQEWGDNVGGQVQQMLLGSVRMWNARLNEWGAGNIYFHVIPLT